MKEITEKMIELLENNDIDKDYWYFELGYADSVDQGKVLGENEMIYSFYEQGKKLWNKYKGQIRGIICDVEKGEPRFLINEVLSGDIRTLVGTLAAIMVAQINISVAVAVPLACLIIKINVNKFCALDWKG